MMLNNQYAFNTFLNEYNTNDKNKKTDNVFCFADTTHYPRHKHFEK